MSNFEVHYSFTCAECEAANLDIRFVFERDENDALQYIRKNAECSRCHARLKKDQALTSVIRIAGSC